MRWGLQDLAMLEARDLEPKILLQRQPTVNEALPYHFWPGCATTVVGEIMSPSLGSRVTSRMLLYIEETLHSCD